MKYLLTLLLSAACAFGATTNLNVTPTTTRAAVTNIVQTLITTRVTGDGVSTNASRTDHAHSGTYEPVIAAGATTQYWRGDKSWQTLSNAVHTIATNVYAYITHLHSASSITAGAFPTSGNYIWPIGAQLGIGVTPASTFVFETLGQVKFWGDAYADANLFVQTNIHSTGAIITNSLQLLAQGTDGILVVTNDNQVTNISRSTFQTALPSGTTDEVWRGDKTWVNFTNWLHQGATNVYSATNHNHGTGTQNYLSKWNAAGTGFEDSTITETNGTVVANGGDIYIYRTNAHASLFLGDKLVPASEGKRLLLRYDITSDKGVLNVYDGGALAYKNLAIDALSILLNSGSLGNVGIATTNADQNLTLGNAVAAGTKLYFHLYGAAADLYMGQSDGGIAGFGPGEVGLIMQAANKPLLLGTSSLQPTVIAYGNSEAFRINSDNINIPSGFTYNINGSPHTHAYEPTFSKGSLVQGDGITLSGTLTDRLVAAGNVTIAIGAHNQPVSTITNLPDFALQSNVTIISNNVTTVEGNLTTVSNTVQTTIGNLTTVSNNVNTVAGNLTTVSNTVQTHISNVTDAHNINTNYFALTNHSVITTVTARSNDWNTAYSHSQASGNPHSATTTDITEGSNLYYTDARVRDVMTNGNTLYVDLVSGNDATAQRGKPALPFLTIAAASAASQSNDVIRLSPGTFDLGSGGVTISNGVSLIGAGKNRTIITSTIALASGGIITPGANTFFKDFTLYGTLTNAFQAPIKNSVTYSTLSGIYLQSVRIAADSDCIYAVSGGNRQWYLYDCDLESAYDTINEQLGHVEAYNSRFIVSAYDGTTGTNQARNILCNGNIKLRNCEISTTNTINKAYGVYNSAGQLDADNCVFNVGSGGGGLYADVYSIANARISNCRMTGYRGWSENLTVGTNTTTGTLTVTNALTADSGAFTNGLTLGGTTVAVVGHTLNTHSGVNIVDPVEGQVLKLDAGLNWVNGTDATGAADLEGLSDVDLGTPSDGQFLKFIGSMWTNSAHGLTYSDVGAAASSHNHAYVTGSGTVNYVPVISASTTNLATSHFYSTSIAGADTTFEINRLGAIPELDFHRAESGASATGVGDVLGQILVFGDYGNGTISLGYLKYIQTSGWSGAWHASGKFSFQMDDGSSTIVEGLSVTHTGIATKGVTDVNGKTPITVSQQVLVPGATTTTNLQVWESGILVSNIANYYSP